MISWEEQQKLLVGLHKKYIEASNKLLLASLAYMTKNTPTYTFPVWLDFEQLIKDGMIEVGGFKSGVPRLGIVYQGYKLTDKGYKKWLELVGNMSKS
jgi:hypothetical protein